jgi:hypothetical protein
MKICDRKRIGKLFWTHRTTYPPQVLDLVKDIFCGPACWERMKNIISGRNDAASTAEDLIAELVLKMYWEYSDMLFL